MSDKNSYDYSSFSQTASAQHWKRIGLKRRSGVNVPLFSIYSKKSTGIGEIPDLKWLIKWTAQNSMSLIQLLPLNDTGQHYAPYDAESSFALDPMYLRLEEIKDLPLFGFKKKIQSLKKKFPTGKKRVNYAIKEEKLSFLKDVFEKTKKKLPKEFKQFVQSQNFWLLDYALFKTIKQKNKGVCWEEWPLLLKERSIESLKQFQAENKEEIVFQQWLQWQLFTQMKNIKKEAHKEKVLLIGDLPFLVSRDSADVWAHQSFFKLDKVAGAPPDLYFAQGQRWGMPTYNWENIKTEDYSYIKEKLKYSENFYDLFRIDHSVGFFRVWSIDIHEPLESHGLNGRFDPEDESVWEEHGRNLLKVLLESTAMLPCAEDLGTIPPCSFKVLEELAIPGMDVQRWKKDWQQTYTFLNPEFYRKNAAAAISTHDMCSFINWWQFEVNTVDRFLLISALNEIGLSLEEIESELFDLKKSQHNRLRWKKEIGSVETLLEKVHSNRDQAWHLVDLYLGSYNESGNFLSFLRVKKSEETNLKKLTRQALLQAGKSASIFSIQMLQDWLSLEDKDFFKNWSARINLPGTVGDQNWSLIYPYPVDQLSQFPFNQEIRKINISSERR